MENKYSDLEFRTERFSLAVRDFCLSCKIDTINREYIKQVVRSAGCVGANYIESQR